MVRVNKKIIIVTLSVLVLVMVIGYSVFSTNLKINGTANIASEWNIVFTKIEEVSKSSGVTVTDTPIASGTNATFNVDFKLPGDEIIYRITVENKGTLDAIIDNINAKASNSSAIEFTIEGLDVGDRLAKKTSTTFDVKISYNSNTTSQPKDTKGTLTLDVTYVQDLGQSIDKVPTTNQYGIVSNGLKGYYDARINASNSTWSDLSGNGINGRVDGATLGNGYYSFDGNDCILLDKMNYPSVTLEAVFEIVKLPGNGDFMDILANLETGGYSIRVDSSSNILTFIYLGNSYKYHNSTHISLNKIYTVSASYDGNQLMMCINGTCQTSYTIGTLKYPDQNTVMAIGCNPQRTDKASRFFNGKIYSARVYSRALTKEEILNNQEKDMTDFNITK